MNFEEEIKKVIKSGVVAVGVKRAKKAILKGSAKLVVIVSGAPDEMKGDIERYASISKIPVYHYKGKAKDLGYTCGKPFPISCLAILDEKDSGILEVCK